MKTAFPSTLSFFRMAWLLLAILTAASVVLPLNFGLVRAFITAGIPLTLLGAVGLLWKRRVWRWLPALLLLLITAVAVLPERNPDIGRLREVYVQRLMTYQGVPYFWGGENRQGIDCSGLVRRALIEADLRVGLATLNPALLRAAYRLWRWDFPAQALRDASQGGTVKIGDGESVNNLENSAAKPGDLAVTRDGRHVMAYLGEGEWIEADPGVGLVIRARVPVMDNPWFDKPVTVVRWRQFEQPGR